MSTNQNQEGDNSLKCLTEYTYSDFLDTLRAQRKERWIAELNAGLELTRSLWRTYWRDPGMKAEILDLRATITELLRGPEAVDRDF